MAWLYDLSFSFFVLIAGAAVVASGVSLVLPALFSNSNNADPIVNWNVIAIVGSYVALAIVSLGIYLSRKITTIQKLRGIPQKVVACKGGDLPSVVACMVAVEYDRSCAIAQISQPQSGVQEGWSLPGTRHESIQFRRAILQSLETLDAAVRHLVPTFPRMRPHQTVETHLRPLGGILTYHDRTCLKVYSDFIQAARYAVHEPSLGDYETCMQIHSSMRQILHQLQPDDIPDNAQGGNLIV